MTALAPLILRRRLPGARPPAFRALEVGEPGALAALRRRRAPLALPPGSPLAAIDDAPADASLRPGAPGRPWTALTLVPEAPDAAPLALTLLVPAGPLAALGGDAQGAARLLAAEIALEPAMAALDAAFGGPVALALDPGAPSTDPARRPRAHWRPFEAVLEGGGRHRAWLGLDTALLPAAAAALARWPERPGGPPVALRAAAEIGGIDLAARRLARLAPGDTILPGPGGIGMDRGRLTLAGRAVARVRISGAEAQLEETPAMTEDDMPSARPPDAGPGGAPPLADLPVRMSFRLPARDLTLAEAQVLVPGSVVPLDLDEDAPMVDLVAAGRIVGRGEVVSVAGRLAVHVLRVPGLG